MIGFAFPGLLRAWTRDSHNCYQQSCRTDICLNVGEGPRQALFLRFQDSGGGLGARDTRDGNPSRVNRVCVRPVPQARVAGADVQQPRSQGLPSLVPWDVKMRDPGNEAGYTSVSTEVVQKKA